MKNLFVSNYNSYLAPKELRNTIPLIGYVKLLRNKSLTKKYNAQDAKQLEEAKQKMLSLPTYDRYDIFFLDDDIPTQAGYYTPEGLEKSYRFFLKEVEEDMQD